MPEQQWTAKMVAERMEEAASTMKRLPRVRPKGYGSSWPPFIQEILEACEPSTVITRLGPPPGEAITRMDECLDWLRWLGPDDARLVWMRAERLQWKPIMVRIGVSRDTAWTRWNMAILRILTRLELLAEGK